MKNHKEVKVGEEDPELLKKFDKVKKKHKRRFIDDDKLFNKGYQEKEKE